MRIFALQTPTISQMEKYMEPSQDEIIMAFVASCIESVADRLNLGYREVFERMDRIGMLDEYIYPCYETLHTESRENLTQSLVETLRRWENQTTETNG